MNSPVFVGVTVGAIVTGTMSAPAHAATVEQASLTWRLSDCAFGGVPACGSLTEAQQTSGNVAKAATGWQFTQGSGTYDPATGHSAIAFSGSVTIGNTNRGGYAISFTDPVVYVGDGGAGSVSADLTYRESAAAPSVTVPDVRLVDLPAVPNARQWEVTPPWDGVGTPDTPAPVDGKQFAQPLIDALPASLRNWFRASGSSSDAAKRPAAVAVAFTSSAEPTWSPEVTVSDTAGWGVNQIRTVTVKGTGFDPSKSGGPVSGMYVVFGPNASGRYGDPGVFGAAQYLPVAPDAAGEFTTQLTITGRYQDSNGKTWDGLADQLGISTWAAHSHAISDWDTFTPITFAKATKASADAKARLTKKKIRKGTKVGLRVKVVADAVPTGQIVVKRGGKVLKRSTLRVKHDGVKRLTLRKGLKFGKQKIWFVYLGNEGVRRDASNRVSLRVVR